MRLGSWKELSRRKRRWLIQSIIVCAVFYPYLAFAGVITSYYANTCASLSTSDEVITYSCRINNSNTGTGNCLYRKRVTSSSGSTIYRKNYACSSSEVWDNFDVDQDGILNGVDPEPYTANIIEDEDGDGVPDSQDQCPGQDNNAIIPSGIWAGETYGADTDGDAIDNCLDYCNPALPCGGACGGLATVQAGYEADLTSEICSDVSGTLCSLGSVSPIGSTADPLYPFDRLYGVSGATCNQSSEFPPLEGDSDGDGIGDSQDACPDDPLNTCPAGDQDGDGIINSDDPCVDDPENTCPAGDQDGDGQINSEDPCPEDADDSCSAPGGDLDGDGQINSEDPCPDDAANSCPAATDTDGDGVFDDVDVCINDPDPACSSRSSAAEDVNVVNIPTVRIEGPITATISEPVEVEGLEDLVIAEEGLADSITDFSDNVATLDETIGELAEALEGQGSDEGGETGGSGGSGGDGTFTGPALDDSIETFGDALSGFVVRVGQSPIISALSGVALPSGVGLPCPVWSIPWPVDPNNPNAELLMDGHCQIAGDIRGILSGIMTLIFIVIGVRIVLSA